jgi:hypothetical protein
VWILLQRAAPTTTNRSGQQLNHWPHKLRRPMESLGRDVSLQSFKLTTFALVSSMTIPNVTGNPLRLVRWGQNGLAFNLDGGPIYLIGGNFVH